MNKAKSLYMGNEIHVMGGLRAKGILKESTPDKPLISIITAVRNGERYLGHTIESVLGQTYGNIEYIVVDGCSTDTTPDIIKKYEDRIDLWVQADPKGISDGMNKGIELSRGEYVGIIHADDWYESDTVERVVQNERFGKAGVICGKLQMWENGKREYIFDSEPALLKKTMTINHPTCFVKREIYKKYRMFSTDFKFGMDYEMLLGFFVKGVEFNSMNYVLANMRRGGNSQNFWGCFKDSFNARKKHLRKPFVLNAALYIWDLIKVAVSRLLTKLGLIRVIKFYRKRIASVKKVWSSA